MFQILVATFMVHITNSFLTSMRRSSPSTSTSSEDEAKTPFIVMEEHEQEALIESIKLKARNQSMIFRRAFGLLFGFIAFLFIACLSRQIIYPLNPLYFERTLMKVLITNFFKLYYIFSIIIFSFCCAFMFKVYFSPSKS